VWSKIFHFIFHQINPGYAIDGNRWVKNQSINQYKSIKLVNWYRLVSVNRWSINNHTKTVHRLLLIGTATSNLSDHLPFLGSPGDEIGKITPTQSSQRKEYTPLHVYSNYPLARHCLSMSLYMSTQQVREEALLNIRCIAKGYHPCRFEVNVCEVFLTRREENVETCLKLLTRQGWEQTFELSKEDEYLWTGHWRERRESCSPVNVQKTKMRCVYSYYVQRRDIYALIPSICNQSIPIDINLSINCYWKSIPIDNHMNLRHRLVIDYQYQSINWYQLVLIDIDCHRLSIWSIGYPRNKRWVHKIK